MKGLRSHDRWTMPQDRKDLYAAANAAAADQERARAPWKPAVPPIDMLSLTMAVGDNYVFGTYSDGIGVHEVLWLCWKHVVNRWFNSGSLITLSDQLYVQSEKQTQGKHSPGVIYHMKPRHTLGACAHCLRKQREMRRNGNKRKLPFIRSHTMPVKPV